MILFLKIICWPTFILSIIGVVLCLIVVLVESPPQRQFDQAIGRCVRWAAAALLSGAALYSFCYP